MLLILQLGLTVAAWMRGWKWLALLPVGVGIVLGLLLGGSANSMGLGASAVGSMGTLFDLIGIVVLGVMVAKPKSNPNVPSVGAPVFGMPPQNAPFVAQPVPPPSPFVQSGANVQSGVYVQPGAVPNPYAQPQAPPNPFVRPGQQ